jgi:hypothetical protein
MYKQFISVVYLLLFVTIFINAAQAGAAQSKEKNIEFGAKRQQQVSIEAMNAVNSISREIQTLKQDVVSLNKGLRLMEEELLFPSSTKYSVFVSMNIGKFFTLESIKLKLDGKLVATHIYSVKQRGALKRGGVHKLYITNLNEGKHTVDVFFTGLGPNGRPYKRAQSLTFDKGKTSEYLELAVVDDEVAQEPVFNVKQW